MMRPIFPHPSRPTVIILLNIRVHVIKGYVNARILDALITLNLIQNDQRYDDHIISISDDFFDSSSPIWYHEIQDRYSDHGYNCIWMQKWFYKNSVFHETAEKHCGSRYKNQINIIIYKGSIEFLTDFGEITIMLTAIMARIAPKNTTAKTYDCARKIQERDGEDCSYVHLWSQYEKNRYAGDTNNPTNQIGYCGVIEILNGSLPISLPIAKTQKQIVFTARKTNQRKMQNYDEFQCNSSIVKNLRIIESHSCLGKKILVFIVRHSLIIFIIFFFCFTSHMSQSRIFVGTRISEEPHITTTKKPWFSNGKNTLCRT
jgi:hypothetical protein